MCIRYDELTTVSKYDDAIYLLPVGVRKTEACKKSLNTYNKSAEVCERIHKKVF